MRAVTLDAPRHHVSLCNKWNFCQNSIEEFDMHLLVFFVCHREVTCQHDSSTCSEMLFVVLDNVKNILKELALFNLLFEK